jgi:hypothetical protein
MSGMSIVLFSEVLAAYQQRHISSVMRCAIAEHKAISKWISALPIGTIDTSADAETVAQFAVDPQAAARLMTTV